MANINPFEIEIEAPPTRIDNIVRIADEAGVEALTDTEYASYRAFRMEREGAWEDGEDHYANLAHEIKDKHEAYWSRLGHTITEKIDDDECTREEWVEMEKEAIRFLGVTPDVAPSADFDGASDAIHPLFAEAAIQFYARAMRVLWPAGGPVKAVPLGDVTEEKLEQASRVQRHMNYHFTKVLKDARKKQAKMLMRLPVSGSYFTKPVYNHQTGVVDRAMIPPEYFVVPYKAESLESAPRYTEKCRLSDNDVKKRMRSGEFIKVDLLRPNEDGHHEIDAMEEIEAAIKITEGRDNSVLEDEDDRHTFYYTAMDLNLPGYEDKDEDDKETGVDLPYLVATERDSMKVVHISRLWREGDPKKRRLVEYYHYEFLPGLGFYGYGFYHILGGLLRGSTGAFRALLDAGGFANFKGGFKNSEMVLKGDSKKVGHGVFADVEWGGDGPLKDQIVVMQYGEPSKVLHALLGDMLEWGRRLMGITETLVGDGTSTVPVGTQLSRVEQGMMVATEIHTSLHAVQAAEFERHAELMWIWGDDEYAYDVPNESRRIKRQDFDPHTVDIGLISNPEHATNAQRYYITEASLDLAARNPEVYDMEEMHRRAQQSIHMEDVDRLVPRRSAMAQRQGPVEENAAILRGMPIKAFSEQDHMAHMTVHEQFASTLGQSDNDLVQIAQAHIREHLSHQYLLEMQLATGVAFSPPEREELLAGEYVPPDQAAENQVAVAAAQAAMEAQAAAQQPDPEQAKVAAEIARADEKAERDNMRRDAMAESSIQRADFQAAADMERNATVAAEKEMRANASTEGQIQRDEAKAGVERAMFEEQQKQKKQPGVPE